MDNINFIKDIQDLITNQVEESIHLDYKAADSLGTSDRKKAEISKNTHTILRRHYFYRQGTFISIKKGPTLLRQTFF